MTNDPSKVRTRQRIALYCTLLLAVVLSAVQTVLYLKGYDFDADLYLPGMLPTVTAVLWIAAAICAAALHCTLPGKTSCSELKIRTSPFTDFAALLATASLAGSLLLPILLKGNGTDALGNLLSSSVESDATARTMLLLSIAFAIPAAIHFILQFVYHRTYPQSACALLLWTAFCALRVYFDMRYLLMSPRRILHLIALISVMLFAIAEMRLARGIVTRRFYSVCASVMLVLAGCDAISNLTVGLMGWGVGLGSELCIYCFLLSVSLYAASRLFALSFAPKIKVAPPSPMAETASKTASEVSEGSIPVEKRDERSDEGDIQ